LGGGDYDGADLVAAPNERPCPDHRRVDHRTSHQIGRQAGALVLGRVEHEAAAEGQLLGNGDEVPQLAQLHDR
jgi:hypothetical protein